MASINITDITKINERYENFLGRIYIDPVTDCWLFKKNNPSNYSRFKTSRKSKAEQGHRYSYEIYKGMIPEGYVIDHLCRVKGCCNPEHLEAVTPKENTRRGTLRENVINRDPVISEKFRKAGIAASALKARQRRYCKRGHEYTEKNTYITPLGWRSCRLCALLRRKGEV